MNQHNSPWSAEDTALLVKLWTSGKSAAECAALLPGNRTRNMCIGRIRRKFTGIRDSEPPHGPRRSPLTGKPSAPALLTGARPLPATAQRKAVLPPDMNIAGYLAAKWHEAEMRKQKRKPKAQQKQRPRPTGKPIPFLALPNDNSLCKFAVTEASPFLFCGAPVRPGYSWCDHCCGIVFNGLSQPSQQTMARDRRVQVAEVGR